ncbi:MAG TPA: hypothetical protein PKG98_07775 [Myxococcota bacterium]|nr:hypothetical protein [Myxococcota bacterium]
MADLGNNSDVTKEDVVADTRDDSVEPLDLVASDESSSDVDLDVSDAEADASDVDAVTCAEVCVAPRQYCVEETDISIRCGECLIDAHCTQAGYTDCVCSPGMAYSCVNDQGLLCSTLPPVCPIECEDASDCGGDHTWMTFDCVQTVGDSKTCVDSNGRCDGTYACCAPGQDCYDMVPVIREVFGVTGTEIFNTLVAPRKNVLTFCGCQTADDCLTGLPCTETSSLCGAGTFTDEQIGQAVCPEGQIHGAFPERICVQPSFFFEFFGFVPEV